MNIEDLVQNRPIEIQCHYCFEPFRVSLTFNEGSEFCEEKQMGSNERFTGEFNHACPSCQTVNKGYSTAIFYTTLSGDILDYESDRWESEVLETLTNPDKMFQEELGELWDTN